MARQNNLYNTLQSQLPVKRILMIAMHFPPQAGSSGVQRTLRFVQHLPALGWQPLVLTAHPMAYEKTDADLLRDIPADTIVQRALAFDTARHLHIGHRYLACMARPDRWVSWRFDATRRGLAMIRQFKPDVIWSTYPIATAHLIASTLQQKTGLPWVADFRDPMAQDGYPADPRTWQTFQRIEADATQRASRCVFTTPSAVRIYQQRYPEAASRMVLLENGYDEESFLAIPPPVHQPCAERPLVLLHSGIVYPSERDPTQLFQALGWLQAHGALSPADIRIRFRAAVHQDMLQTLARRYQAQDFIQLCAALPYRQALAEMLSVDALLVLQASNCNAQIPAKLYEYLRAGKPVLGLTDPQGDTAATLHHAGLHDVVPLDSADAIVQALPLFVAKLRRGTAALAHPQVVQQASRQERSKSLVQMLEQVI